MLSVLYFGVILVKNGDSRIKRDMRYYINNILVILMLSVFCLVPAAGASIHGENVGSGDLQDQRTFSGYFDYDPDQSQGGLDGSWPYTYEFSFAWNVSYNEDAMLWHYEYSLPLMGQNISHFVLEVSEGAQVSDFSNITVNGNVPAGIEDLKEWSDVLGYPFPNSFYGIKFDSGGSTFSFDTERSPVWGNFFAKGGVYYEGESEKVRIRTYNSGLAVDGFESDDKLDFIVRPNGVPVVPEPVSSTLFIAGAAAFGLRGLKKRRDK